MKKLLYVTCLSYSSIYVLDKTNNIQYYPRLNGIVRGLRVFKSGVKISFFYYKHGINSHSHSYSSEILYSTLVKNGGAYVKLGQVIAQLDNILPPIFCERMKPMCNYCEKIETKEVEKILNKYYKDYTKVFSYFNENPIGIASLAQVHKAKLISGEDVAVKIQHPRLEREVIADVKIIKLATKIASFLFPEFKYEWLGDQFERNLPKELNFLNEGKNCERFKENFKGKDYICAPKVYFQHSNERILVMSYEEGGSIEDGKYLKENKISPKEISKLLTLNFNEQIFKFGFVHADPHSGNMLVRKLSNGKIQLVMLDHGLYRELDDEFRYYYSKFWIGIVKQNENLIKEACIGLNIKQYQLFVSIILSKRYENVMKDNTKYDENRFSQKLNKIEQSNLRKDATESHKDITHLLNEVRQEMLLLLKINEYLRAIDRKLGNPYNNFIEMMKIIYVQLGNNKIFKNKKESLLGIYIEKVYLIFVFKFLSMIGFIRSIFKNRNLDEEYFVFSENNVISS